MKPAQESTVWKQNKTKLKQTKQKKETNKTKQKHFSEHWHGEWVGIGERK